MSTTDTVPRELLAAENAEERLSVISALIGPMPARAGGREWCDEVISLVHNIALGSPADVLAVHWRRIERAGAPGSYLRTAAAGMEEG